ncbi:epoxide hydrolase family protein [Micromonospora sp. NPDC047074]|uniref:epoxide hydrolase family protein n=1 Tax=Micromonospora sp. NPDC047074 TaxID=3154339 RepID=UPI003405B5F0
MLPLPQAVPFTIDVPDELLADLAERLARTRFPRPTASGWCAGTDPDYLRELVTYWRSDFDWRARERELNAVPHYTASLDGRRVHFVHLRAAPSSGSPSPLPLVLTHGWPSSFVEMLPLAARLADPAAYGGEQGDAFDVVVPSLPGFVFSDLPSHGLVTPPVVADLWARLMTDVLGYSTFGAYGGDIGSHVTGFIGARHPQRVVGIHTHHPNLHPVLDGAHPLSAAEQAYLKARSDEHDGSDDGYAAIQSTRPDTLAAALLDSPAGLAAWIVEKYRAWSDCDGDLESRFSKDLLLTVATLYWATGTIGSSFRPYYDDSRTPPLEAVDVPAGVRLTPEDRDYPREYAERVYRDLRQWRGPTRGGHFLPLEEPDVLANDLRDFFRPLRRGA